VAIHQYKQPDARNSCNPSINRPLELPRHVTAGQDVDSLQEPDPTCEDQKYTDDVQEDFHNNLLCYTGLNDEIIKSVSC